MVYSGAIRLSLYPGIDTVKAMRRFDSFTPLPLGDSMIIKTKVKHLKNEHIHGDDILFGLGEELISFYDIKIPENIEDWYKLQKENVHDRL